MTSTGKKARKRYGNRFAAKRVRNDAGKPATKKARKKFGKLSHSVELGNATAAPADNAAFTARVMAKRRERGQELDSCAGVW